MNAFIPTLIAVLLAEFGGRSTQFTRLPRLSLAATLLGLSVGIAAFAGFSLAPTMNAHARALMLGVALVLMCCGQFGKAILGDPPASFAGTLLFVWRSGAPFLAFAVDDIRRIARDNDLRPLAELARSLESSIADSGGATMVLPFLEAMGDAVGCDSIDSAATQSYLASVGLRLHG